MKEEKISLEKFCDVITPSKIIIEKEDVDKIETDNHQVYFPSIRFKFLLDHCSLRPGKTHGFLGTTGSGKSTLIRTLVCDAAITCKVMVYATEDTVEGFSMFTNKIVSRKEILNNILFFSESDFIKNINIKNTEMFFLYLRNKIVSTGAGLFVYDNLTTSDYYESLTPAGQTSFFNRLCEMAKDLNIPIVFVAHTQKGVTDSKSILMEPTHIRGSAAPANKADYFYIFRRIKIINKIGNEQAFSWIYVDKSRFHSNGRKNYQLHFDFITKSYTRDEDLDHPQLKCTWRTRCK